MRLEHILAIVLYMAVVALEGSTRIKVVKIYSIVVKTGRLSDQNELLSVGLRRVAHVLNTLTGIKRGL